MPKLLLGCHLNGHKFVRLVYDHLSDNQSGINFALNTHRGGS